MDDLQAARALGWASVAIAATEIVGQGTVERDLLGIDEHPTLLHALGARELAAGVTILSQTKITPTLAAGLWSRVAGDAMDLALLGIAGPRTRKPANFASSTLMVLGITALDVIVAWRVQRRLASVPAPLRDIAARGVPQRRVPVATHAGAAETVESAGR